MSAEQVRLLPAREPGEILDRARRKHRPRETFVLFSGGKDSSVTLDYLARHHRSAIDGVLHISTGIGLASTREFVRSFCAERELPLFESVTPPSEYEAMVREDGFPGPGVHGIAYARLKERALDRFIRERKAGRFDRISFVTGVRISESRRRMGKCIDVRRDGAQVWIAPLIDWTNAEMARYRAEYAVPMSPASELIHLSGECLCGGMADDDPGAELALLVTFFGDDPAVQKILRLQDELRTAGHPRWRWGVKVAAAQEVVDLGMMPLCFDCTQAGAR